MFSNITTFHLNSTYEFEMKTKFYIGYGDYEEGYYNSVYDCKRGVNNSCNSSVPYTSYYEFVPSFSNGNSCFTFGNPIFYKGHAFQAMSSLSNDDSQGFGQIIGADYSEMKPGFFSAVGCNSNENSNNVIYSLQQYCTNTENYTLSAQTSTCDSFNASFEILNEKAQLAAGSIKIDFDDILSRLNITLINGTILKNSILNCTAPNCGFYLNSNLGMCPRGI
uniref:Uncharacterized protein n=1 Tax=Acrobeloides nanus TaxID=290746 RepID=A0A914C3A5_9BILA